MNKIVGCVRLPPYGRLRLVPAARTQDAQHGDLITGLEFRAPQTVLPYLERQRAALYHLKPNLPEELLHVREGEYSVQLERLRFGNERTHQLSAHALSLGVAGYGQRANLRDGGAVEVQCSTTQQRGALEHYREIADGFGHFELGARQHDALGRVAIDEIENRRNVAHDRLADIESAYGAVRFDECVGLYSTDHAACSSRNTILVPISSPASALASAFSAAPGAIRT